MTKGRDIAAESISDLLEVAHLQRRNGMLRVEYSQGGYLEEGEIYLQAGEPISAHVGSLTGNEALHYLLGWRNIYFAFSTEIPSPSVNIVSGVRAGRASAPVNPMFAPPSQGPRWNLVEEHTAAVAPRTPPSVSNMTWLVPQKAAHAQNALSFSLTRRQRLIYFLIDGQRSVGDIARTTGKSVMDVELMLSELQERGLIVM
ncbi:MAG: DUF4388 domain-containing protein [Ktedonobacteraceae bacterium]